MSEFRPKKMLVTGSAGFIGSNFVRYILKNWQDIHVVSLDKLTYAGNLYNLANLPDESRHFFVKGDICDQGLVDEILIEHSIDTIVHFAAESHVDRSIEGPAPFIQTNIVGTFTLLEAAKKYWLDKKKWDSTNCRFHHISTDEVYGELGPNDVPFTEETPYKPSSPYSASKASSDHLVRAYFRTFGLPATISNCSNNFGPYQHPEKLIPTVIRCCIQQKPIPVYGNGSNIRDWLYVEDHCSAIDSILHKGTVGETYNIGGSCEKDNLTLVKMICEIMDELHTSGKPHLKLISFVTDRLGHDFRYAINSIKIKDSTGWDVGNDFLIFLEKTVGFFLNKTV